MISAFGVEHTIYKAAPGSAFKQMSNAQDLGMRLSRKAQQKPGRKYSHATSRAQMVAIKAGSRVGGQKRKLP